jgi:hypothetical protein
MLAVTAIAQVDRRRRNRVEQREEESAIVFPAEQRDVANDE